MGGRGGEDFRSRMMQTMQQYQRGMRPGMPGGSAGPMLGGGMSGFARKMGGVGGPGAGMALQPRTGTSYTSSPGTEEEEEAEMNLVEVAVYGLASLYEKYPPKPASAAPATEPGK
jgi:hypothetical protein